MSRSASCTAELAADDVKAPSTQVVSIRMANVFLRGFTEQVLDLALALDEGSHHLGIEMRG